MAKGNPWERKALLKEFREKHGFSEEDADSIGRARNETTRLVLDKLNAVGASPEQQQEDLNTYLEAHVKRRIYEQGLENKTTDLDFLYFLCYDLSMFFYIGAKQ